MKTSKIWHYSFIFLFIVGWMAMAGENVVSLNVGDQAPAIIANDQNGNLWQLKDHLSKKFLVIYFYPAAMTSGCTKQACSYRDQKADLANLNVEVVGISGDPVSSLQIFQEANQLNFTLLSDVSGEIAQKYGVPLKPGGTINRTINNQEVQLKQFASAARWTFIVDSQGKIVYKKMGVNPGKDSQEVIEFIKSVK